MLMIKKLSLNSTTQIMRRKNLNVKIGGFITLQHVAIKQKVGNGNLNVILLLQLNLEDNNLGYSE